MMPIANPVSLTDDAGSHLGVPRGLRLVPGATTCPDFLFAPLDDAPDAAKSGLELSQKANGFLPNLVRLLANAPVALETYQTLSGINARSGLRLAEREAVQITAAATHGCGFCVAGHTVVAYKKRATCLKP